MATFASVADCPSCKLYKYCDSPKMEGRGLLVHPEALLIGEAPGRNEDQKGTVFVGDPGKFLDAALVETGFDLTRLRYTNAVRCRPYNNRTPKETEILACRPALMAELEECAPKVTILLGRTATQSVLKTKAGESRGKWLQKDGNIYVPTWHPARLIRERHNETVHREFYADLRAAFNIAKNGRLKVPFPEIAIPLTMDEIRVKMRRMLDNADRVAFDFETTGLRAEKPEFQILSCSFSWGTGFGPPVDDLEYETFVVPLHHPHSPLNQEEREELTALIREFLENPDIDKIMQNAAFEYQVALRHLKVQMKGRLWDTMLLHALWDELAPHSLEYLSWVFTPWQGFKSLADDEFKGLKRKDRKYANIPYIVYERVFDAEATHEWLQKYQEEIVIYWVTHKGIAKEKAARKFRTVFRKAQDEEAATEAATEIYNRTIALAVKRRPKEPDPIFKNTGKIVGGLALYNGMDSHCTRYLASFLPQKVEEAGTMGVYEEVLEPEISVFSKMMSRGVKLDRSYLTAMQSHFELELERLEGKLMDKPELKNKQGFNWKSPKQLGELLYKELGMRIPLTPEEIKKKEDGDGPPSAWGWGVPLSETGLPSTDEENLTILARKYKGIPALIMQMREIQKGKGTYVDSYLESKPGKEAHIQADNMVHTEFKTGDVVTGRIASKNPNLQNIPHAPIIMSASAQEISNIFKALKEDALRQLGWKTVDPKRNKGENREIYCEPGCDYVIIGGESKHNGEIKKSVMMKKAFISSWEQGCLVDADYSGIELRVLASVSKDPQLIKDLTSTVMINGKPKTGDVHRMTASTIYGISPNDVTDEQRQRAKKSLFSILYGKTVWGLAGDLGISEAAAKAIISGIFRRYPMVKAAVDRCHAFLHKYGYVRAVNGRVRHFPEVFSGDEKLMHKAERESFNHWIQSPAADLTAASLCRIWNFLEGNGYQSRPCLTVHDSITVDTHPDEKEAVMTIVKTTMEHPPVDWLVVPVTVDIHALHTWGDVK